MTEQTEPVKKIALISRPTKKQKQILDFIDSFIASNEISPSYREIMDGCGYSSVSTVAKHIENLIGRGHLVKTQHHARTLELTKPELSAPAPIAKANHKDWLISEVETKLAGDTAAQHEAQTLINAVYILGYEAESSKLQDKLEKLRDTKDD